MLDCTALHLAVRFLTHIRVSTAAKMV